MLQNFNTGSILIASFIFYCSLKLLFSWVLYRVEQEADVGKNPIWKRGKNTCKLFHVPVIYCKLKRLQKPVLDTVFLMKFLSTASLFLNMYCLYLFLKQGFANFIVTNVTLARMAFEKSLIQGN